MDFFDANDLLNEQPMRWLVPGRIPEESIGLLIGPESCFKSQTALDAALSLGSRQDTWLGLPIPTVPTFYVCAEGAKQAISERVKIWMHTHGVCPERGMVGFHFEPVSFNSTTALRQFGQKLGDRAHPPRFIVFDTVAASLCGADEKDGTTVSGIINQLRALARPLKATVLLVHHTPHNDLTRARGAGNWTMDTDWWYRFKREAQSERFEIRTGRLKDATVPPALTARAPVVSLPDSEITGVHVEVVGERTITAGKAKKSKRPADLKAEVFTTLQQIATHELGHQTLRTADADALVTVSPATFHRHLKQLETAGYLDRPARGQVRVTDKSWSLFPEVSKLAVVSPA